MAEIAGRVFQRPEPLEGRVRRRHGLFDHGDIVRQNLARAPTWRPTASSAARRARPRLGEQVARRRRDESPPVRRPAFVRRRPARRSFACAKSRIEVGQTRFRSAPQGNREWIVLAELIRVFIEVDDPNVLRHRSRRLVIDILPKQVHSHDQQQHRISSAARAARATRTAGPGHKADDRPGIQAGRALCPARRRPALRAARRRQPTRSRRRALDDAAADQDRRIPRREQHFDRPAHRLGRRAKVRIRAAPTGSDPVRPRPFAHPSGSKETRARSAASVPSASPAARQKANLRPARPRPPISSTAERRRPCRPTESAPRTAAGDLVGRP